MVETLLTSCFMEKSLSCLLALCLFVKSLLSCCLHVAFMYYGARSEALRAPELAEQSGLALGSIWKALGSLWKALGSVLEASRELLEAS